MLASDDSKVFQNEKMVEGSAILGSSSPRIGAVMMGRELVRGQLVGITHHFPLSGS